MGLYGPIHCHTSEKALVGPPRPWSSERRPLLEPELAVFEFLEASAWKPAGWLGWPGLNTHTTPVLTTGGYYQQGHKTHECVYRLFICFQSTYVCSCAFITVRIDIDDDYYVVVLIAVAIIVFILAVFAFCISI